jgi:hypothetical protein
MNPIRQLLTMACVCGAVLAAAPARSQMLPQIFQLSVSVTVNEPATQPTQYWIGVAVENIGDVVARWLKLQPGQGLVISKVIPGSPADGCLQANDLLLEIDGKPLKEQTDLVNAAAAGKPLRLLIQRDDARLTIQLTPHERPAIMLPHIVALPTSPSGSAQSNRVPLKGGFLDIGPGYRLNTNALPNNVGSEKIWKMAQGGNCVIISQTKSLQGQMHSSITLNEKTYDITAENFASLPPEIRDLASSLGLLPTAQPGDAQPSSGQAAPPVSDGSAKILRDQQDQIAELKKQLDALSRQLRQMDAKKQPASQP